MLGSLLGGGGGFVFLPLLTLVVGVPAQTAVVTSLVATLPVCIAGSVAHFRRGNIDFKVGAVFALSGIIGAVANGHRRGLNCVGINWNYHGLFLLIKNW